MSFRVHEKKTFSKTRKYYIFEIKKLKRISFRVNEKSFSPYNIQYDILSLIQNFRNFKGTKGTKIKLRYIELCA